MSAGFMVDPKHLHVRDYGHKCEAAGCVSVHYVIPKAQRTGTALSGRPRRTVRTKYQPFLHGDRVRWNYPHRRYGVRRPVAGEGIVRSCEPAGTLVRLDDGTDVTVTTAKCELVRETGGSQ